MNEQEREQQSRRDQNKLTLMSFVNYATANPDQRFWQALANWSQTLIFAAKRSMSPLHFLDPALHDTWEWKDKQELPK